MLSQHFQPDHPTSEHDTHTRQLFHNCCIAPVSREETKIHTERADKLQSVLSEWTGGGHYASSAELCGEDRMSDGRPANSGQMPSRSPPPHPPPPTEAPSAEVGGIHECDEQGCRKHLQFNFNQLYCTGVLHCRYLSV